MAQNNLALCKYVSLMCLIDAQMGEAPFSESSTVT